ALLTASRICEFVRWPARVNTVGLEQHAGERGEARPKVALDRAGHHIAAFDGRQRRLEFHAVRFEALHEERAGNLETSRIAATRPDNVNGKIEPAETLRGVARA